MRPIVLTILDGWGYSKEKVGNAIFNARKPNLDSIEKKYPSVLLQASGLAAGMTWGEAGNSEVGHLTLGAGRIIPQYLTRINRDIQSGYFFENPELIKAISHAKSENSTLHILGLLGSGSVHSYFNHIWALLELLKKNNLSNFYLHFFTDGKDSSPRGSISLLRKLDEYSPGSVSRVATIIGRDFAMDRTGQWDMTQKAYDLWTQGAGEPAHDIYKILEDYHLRGINDSNIPPTVINPDGAIKDGDVLVFFNFREDSMRQIIKPFIDDYFNFFTRKAFERLFVAGFSPYTESTKLHCAYPAPQITNGLAEFLSIHGKTQFHIAETEKYAHVTYFFNGLRNKPFDGETDLLIKSLPESVGTPQMRSNEIISSVIDKLNKDHYDLFVINLANADALAHLGNLEAVKAGVEAIDNELGRLLETVLRKDGVLMITADHGNAERVVYKSSGDPETKHDQNPVPLYLVGREFEKDRSPVEIQVSRQESVGILSDIAPTILELMDLPIPDEMTGDSLLRIIS